MAAWKRAASILATSGSSRVASSDQPASAGSSGSARRAVSIRMTRPQRCTIGSRRSRPDAIPSAAAAVASG